MASWRDSGAIQWLLDKYSVDIRAYRFTQIRALVPQRGISGHNLVGARAFRPPVSQRKEVP